MVKAHFVSDVHLSDTDHSRYREFIRFLRSLNLENCTHLFMVGDIFDLWLSGHDYFVRKHQEVIAEIRRLRTIGVEVHYFEGNHDLYLKDFWQKELGVQVHVGPKTFELDRVKVRVEHGDQINLEDYGYRFLRWFLRTPLMVFLARHLPEKIVVAIGERASRKSRHYTSHVKSISPAKTIENLKAHAHKWVNREPFDLLISGHVHVPWDYHFTAHGRPIRALNLGTWLHKRCQATFAGHGASYTIELVEIEAEPEVSGPIYSQ